MTGPPLFKLVKFTDSIMERYITALLYFLWEVKT